MSIKVLTAKHDVNPIGVALGYNKKTTNYIDSLLPELLTTSNKSFDLYIHPNADDETSNRDITWYVYALNKADFIITSIIAENDDEFVESMNFITSYAKHPSLNNVYMIVDCSNIIGNEDYKNAIINVINDTENTVLFMAVAEKEELLNVTNDVISMISDLSAFTLTDNNGEKFTESVEEEACECECDHCASEEECECDTCSEPITEDE